MKFYKILLPASFIVFLAACKKEDQAIDGYSSLISIDSVAAGVECSNGGYNIKTGIDKNRNNILDEIEVTEDHYVCNGADGNAASDKQVVFNLGTISASSGYSGLDLYSITEVLLPNFNIKNYPGVDSVVLFGTVAIGSIFGNANTTNTLELFNLTTHTPIANSAVVTPPGSTYSAARLHASANAYSSFPSGPFDLGLKLSVAPGYSASCKSDVIMILYRK